MPHYIALIHKDADSCYGVSFPDWPACSRLAIRSTRRSAGAEVLEVAAEDWQHPNGSKAIPSPRTIDELRTDTEFQQDATDAMIAAVPFRATAEAAE